MTDIAMTGARGFLGWHTRLAAAERGATVVPVAVGEEFDLNAAVEALDGSSRALHLAGVNRASDDVLREGNIRFAEQFAQALVRCPNPPETVVYANSIQSANASPYGEGKRRAAEVVASATKQVGSTFLDLDLPNLFGEHGKPFYNAVTSTFCHLLSQGEEPSIEVDRELTLLHAQNAADLLVGSVRPEQQANLESHLSVSELLTRLRGIAGTYAAGEIPDIAEPLDRDLFNTYRSYTFEALTPISLTRHADQRGSFFEIIRSRGGSGQSSFSTTAPGVSRGDHFHRRKIERFTVLAGSATIALRRMFDRREYKFAVDGDRPMAVDMPTGWTHKITNTGENDLYTSFWTDQIFDPRNPDTIAEAV